MNRSWPNNEIYGSTEALYVSSSHLPGDASDDSPQRWPGNVSGHYERYNATILSVLSPGFTKVRVTYCNQTC
jgi:hypothetical protein